MRLVLLAVWALARLQGAEDGFRFAIVGDRTGETVPGVYARVWREIAAERFDFAINVGDTIQGGHDATAEAEWRAVRPVWRRAGLPFYFTPGNHDIWSEGSRKLYERETGRPGWYGFDFKGAHFTVLDNSGSFQLSDGQMAFLERDLKAHAGAGVKVVLFHQPFWLLPLKLGSTDFAFHALMRKYRVAYVICGHVHQFSRMERDGVTYLVVGSSGGHLRGHDPAVAFAQGWFYHYVSARVRGTQMEAEVRELGAPFGEGRRFRVEEWREFGGLAGKE